jgi:hypothetical protein
MYTDPKQNLIQVDHILIEQFRRKGYKCEEIKEQNATIIIISHERKNADTPPLNETYKDLLKAN